MPIATLVGSFDSKPQVKNLKYLQLLDCYGALLTPNRREICELYYGCDLSLAEIAEQKGVSRQSVSETLKESRRLLDSYEEKLKHNELNRQYSLEVSFMMTKVVRALCEFKTAHPEFSEEMDSVMDLVSVGERINSGKEEE